jgi:hypothetical protein
MFGDWCPEEYAGAQEDKFIYDSKVDILVIKIKQSRYRPGVAQRVPGS